MLEPLLEFKNQFNYTPVVRNKKNKKYKHFIVCGMGGSAISAKILLDIFADIDIKVHSDYGLPKVLSKSDTLIIISSFSGMTEEALDSYNSAISSGYHLAVVTTGGTLLESAEKDIIQHIVIPKDNLQPRFSTGYQMLALLKMMALPVYSQTLEAAASKIDTSMCKKKGKHMADYCGSKYVNIYTHMSMFGVSYAIMAAIHEGAKRPSFLNILPESNHNELESHSSLTKEEKSNFMSLLVKDDTNHPRIKKRLEILNHLYLENSLSPYLFETNSASVQNVLETLLTGYFMATYLALASDIDPFITPLIADFKNRLQ